MGEGRRCEARSDDDTGCILPDAHTVLHDDGIVQWSGTAKFAGPSRARAPDERRSAGLRDRVVRDDKALVLSQPGAPVRIKLDGGPDPERVARLVQKSLEKLGRGLAASRPEACEHKFVDDNFVDALVCSECDVRVEREALRALGYFRFRADYDARANSLADEGQILRDENTALLAENARLRREIERAKR